MKKIILKINKTYSIEDVCLIAKNKAKVIVENDVLQKVKENFDAVKNLEKRTSIYGLTTGVGDLSQQRTTVPTDVYQRNILLSHSVGVGENLSKEISRAIMFSRLITLSNGMSGVSTELLIYIQECLNNETIPSVASLGSIGASDLTILAAIFVDYPNTLQTREGLALINGNSAAIGISSIVINELQQFLENALISSALSLQARGSTSSAFNPANQQVKSFRGQKVIAKQLQKQLEGSDQIVSSYKNGKN